MVRLMETESWKDVPLGGARLTAAVRPSTTAHTHAYSHGPPALTKVTPELRADPAGAGGGDGVSGLRRASRKAADDLGPAQKLARRDAATDRALSDVVLGCLQRVAPPTALHELRPPIGSGGAATDEAAIDKAAGHLVRLVPGFRERLRAGQATTLDASNASASQLRRSAGSLEKRSDAAVRLMQLLNGGTEIDHLGADPDPDAVRHDLALPLLVPRTHVPVSGVAAGYNMQVHMRCGRSPAPTRPPGSRVALWCGGAVVRWCGGAVVRPYADACPN